MPGAGSLDRRITIERFTATTNNLNEEVKTWAALITVSARRRDVSDGEAIKAGELGAFQRARFVIRYGTITATVNPKDRINFDGSLWNISSARETQEGRKRFIEITATREAD